MNKVDAAKTDTGLQGATFKVYVAEDQTTCDGSNLNTSGSAIMVGTQEDFTTGSNGQVTFGGAHLNTVSVESGDPEPGKTRCFIIEETAAPAGYVLPSGNNAKRAVLVNSTQPGQLVQVTNQQVTDVPQLPLTGASGRAILLILGSSLMLISLGAFLVLRRRTLVNR